MTRVEIGTESGVLVERPQLSTRVSFARFPKWPRSFRVANCSFLIDPGPPNLNTIVFFYNFPPSSLTVPFAYLDRVWTPSFWPLISLLFLRLLVHPVEFVQRRTIILKIPASFPGSRKFLFVCRHSPTLGSNMFTLTGVPLLLPLVIVY